jgi:pyruvate dehydrogenase E2 component (dihydrolipoamide acetyltransferase)
MEKWAENLDEVTIGEWLKREGDSVAPGEAVAELITEKATFKYEPETGGVLLRIYAEENSTVPVGFVIGYLGHPGEEPPPGIEIENQALIRAKKREARLDLDLAGDRPPLEPSAEYRPVRATPAARRLARDGGVTVEEVAAFLADGRRITDRDVRAYLQSKRAQEADHGSA